MAALWWRRIATASAQSFLNSTSPNQKITSVHAHKKMSTRAIDTPIHATGHYQKGTCRGNQRVSGFSLVAILAVMAILAIFDRAQSMMDCLQRSNHAPFTLLGSSIFIPGDC